MVGPARARLFVAVWPPEGLRAKLRCLPRPELRGLRWTTEDQWHVTLRFLGELDETSLLAVSRALDRLPAALAPAGVTLPVVASTARQPETLGRGVWVLPVAGLDPLARLVEELTGGSAAAVVSSVAGVPLKGGPGPRRPFRGHLTLARARHPGALGELASPPMDLHEAWVVERVTLVRSTLSREGARYQVMGAWPLRGDLSPPGGQSAAEGDARTRSSGGGR